MNWRPEGWQESREAEHQRHVVEGYAGVDLLHYDRGFEAGADALLEALRNKARSEYPLICGSCRTRHSPDEPCAPDGAVPQYGVIVFIPDEEGK